jgi:hypothetical protein
LIKLAIKPSANGVREFGWVDGDRIRIPVIDPTLGGDQAIKIDGYRLHLAGSGWQWESDWRNSAHNLAFFDPGFDLVEDLPEWVRIQVKQGHVTAQIELAWVPYQFNPPVRAQAATSGSAFAVPGIGHCWTEPSAEIGRFRISERSECAAPLTLPPVYLIGIDSDGNRCTGKNGDQEVPAGHMAYEMEFGSSNSAYFDPNPVRSFSLTAGNWVPALPPQKPGEVEYRGASVCPGGSFTVRTGKELQRQRATFDLGDIGVGKKIDESPEQGTAKFNPDNE